MTQEELSVRLQLFGLDMDRTAVAKIESQLRSVFDFELIVFARTLKVSTDALCPEDRQLKKQLPALMEGKIPGK